MTDFLSNSGKCDKNTAKKSSRCGSFAGREGFFHHFFVWVLKLGVEFDILIISYMHYLRASVSIYGRWSVKPLTVENYRNLY